MEAVVLAGGPGRGLSSITRGKSKTLIPLCGEPLIVKVLRGLESVGTRKAVIVTDKVEDFQRVLYSADVSLEIELRRQTKPEVSGAIMEAVDTLRKGALLVYGDTLVPPNAYILTYSTAVESGIPTIMVVPNEDVGLYGAVLMREGGLVSKFYEKPMRPMEGAYAFGGIAVLNDELLSELESLGRIDEAINTYIKKGGKIRTTIWSDWWVDIGYPINLLEAAYYLMKDLKVSRISADASIAKTVVIEGPVIIDEGAVIDNYSVIKGPAYIGKNSFIGAHSFIRAYTSIEEEALVGSYTEVTWSVIGRKATIGRGSFLGYSIVGEEAIIEPNVMTKILIREEEGIKSIKTYKKRKEYRKAGSVISAGTRVSAGTMLTPGSFIE